MKKDEMDEPWICVVQKEEESVRMGDVRVINK